MEFRFQVNTYGDPKGNWVGNALTYETAEVAEEKARDLFQRWTAVEFWRVIDKDEKVLATGP